jgi:DNA-binding NtrC family response regulator
MNSHSIELGICSDELATSALLRSAALKLGCENRRLAPDGALDWLTQHTRAALLFDAAKFTSASQQALVAWPTAVLRRVVLLRPMDCDAVWSEGLAQTQRHCLPTKLPDAMELLQTVMTKMAALPVSAEPGPAARRASYHPSDLMLDDFDINDDAFTTARRLAQYPVDLLISGETGSGKDTLARFIYEHSGATGAYVPVNCAAIPETLAESELFGFEAGTFTGASRAKAGKIEDADKGVLYLDEVDSCPLWLQAKLLRALQDKGVERVGSSRFRRSDFRLIASSKADLKKLVEQGKFRQDLFFRLSGIEIKMPPLRRQPDRLQMLFQRFVMDSCKRFGVECQALDADTLSWLMAHNWPGNIRELKTAATKYALSLGTGPLVPEEVKKTPWRTALDACERGLLMSALVRTRGSVLLASDELGMPLNTLYYRLKRLGINQKTLPRFEDSRGVVN